MQRRLWLLVVVGLLGVAATWWWTDVTSPGPAAVDAAPRPVASALAAGAPPVAAVDSRRVERTVATGASADDVRREEPHGELLVQVVWADGTPAAGIRVHVARDAPGVSVPLAELVSDASGEARATVRAGDVAIVGDRGARARGNVIAGEQRKVRLQLAAGVDVEGTVRDVSGTPVAGALVWLTNHQVAWSAGGFVATADAGGAFALRAVPKQQSIGAVARGFEPSTLVDLELLDTTKAPVKVELVVAPGGAALTGRVVDEQGAGVAGAMVAVGTSERLVEHVMGNRAEERWAPRRTVTGDGRYRLDALAPGRHPVEVWAAAFPFARAECTLASHEEAVLDVTLRRGVTVHGVVTGEDGAPAAGAVVRAFPVAIDTSYLQLGQYDHESAFGYPFAVADELGRYRLLRAAPGELHLYAGPGDRRDRPTVVPWANDLLHAAPGDVVEWNPRIDAGSQIHGIVRFRDGVPMQRVFVSLLPANGVRQSVQSDEQGRFRFVRLQKQPYDVGVQFWSAPKDAPPLGARDVWPESGELELTAAFDSPRQSVAGSVRGMVSDGAGRAKPAVGLSVRLLGERTQYPPIPVGPAGFEFADVEPGLWRLTVMSGEEPIHFGSRFELAPAERKDVGTLVTEPGGRLRLHVVRGPGTENLEVRVYVHPAGCWPPRRITLAANVVDATIDNLCAGPQLLAANAPGVKSVRERACTIVAGAEVETTIELHAAVARTLVVEYGAEQRVTHVRVDDARGEQMFDYQPTGVALPRPFRWELRLPLGRATVVVETEGGGMARAEFEMTSLAADQPPIVVRAK